MHKPVVLLLLTTLSIQPLYSAAAGKITDTAQLSCKEKAAHLLDEALAILKQRYYKKDSVQWNVLLANAKARLEAAGTCEEATGIIDWCFQQLNETHSFIMKPAKAAVYNYDTARLTTPPPLHQLVGDIKGELPEKDIAYITVPWISTTNAAICTRIADSLQQLIATLDAQGISKWIIDLRNNKGGNCWPMLAGIGPLLGNGTCGYFVSASEKIPISYRDGIAYHGRYPRCSVSTKAYQLKNENKWVAVLTGAKTSSSGELVALAFKQREQVYFYGEPTAGFTTANTTFTLSDRSMLVVTVCREADRTGAIQEGKIIPHEIIDTGAASREDDIVKKKALMWLQSIWLQDASSHRPY